MPSPLQVSQCQLFNLTFQVARSSDGLLNAIEVVMLEHFQNDMSIANFTISGEQQIFSVNFLATSLREGEYFACKLHSHCLSKYIHIHFKANIVFIGYYNTTTVKLISFQGGFIWYS